MKHIISSLIITILIPVLLVQPVAAQEAEVPNNDLKITEVKVKADTSSRLTTEPNAYYEFIEVYNAGTETINLNQVYLAYFPIHNSEPNAVADPAHIVVLGNGLLEPNAYFTRENYPLSSTAKVLNAPALPFGLRDAGGEVRLLSLDNTVIDRLAWVNTAKDAIAPVVRLFDSVKIDSVTVSANQLSFQRQASGTIWELLPPTPQSSVLAPLPVPEVETVPTEEPELPAETIPEEAVVNEEVLEPEDETATLLPLIITEILPNPAAPATDTTDEYVEVFNPNPQPILLAHYTMQTGNTYSYSYQFATESVPAYGYAVFYARDTHLTLSNSSGKARLLDSDGVVVSEVAAYGTAKDGEAWALISGTWQWTATLTPGATNLATPPLLAVAKTVASKKATAAKAKAKPKPKATPKKVAAKTTKKTTKKTATKKPIAAASLEKPKTPIHPRVLAGVVSLAILYAAYEYRKDLTNKLHQLRNYRTIRRSLRPKTQRG